MGGYSSSGGSYAGQNQGQYSNQQTGTSQYNTTGTNTINPTALWGQLSTTAGGLTGSDGLTQAQRGALNTVSYDAQNQPMGWALNSLNTGGLQNIVDAQAPTVAAPGQVSTSQVAAPTAASMMSPYAQLYSQELVNPALQQYDYGTDRALSALDARTAAAGGFANSRSGLAYSDLANQAALGRGALEAQLKGQGLQGAISAGQGDAAGQLTA